MAIMAGFTNPETSGTLKTVRVATDGAIVTQDNYAQRLAYNGSGLPEYIGIAKAGTATSAATWQIKKLVYSGSSVTSIIWADGDSNFDNVWDNYASLSYS